MQSYKGFHRGRLKQIPIYLGKFFRTFIYMSDWKVLPMAVIIAGIVAYVACGYMFQTMEGTVMGAMALTCVCLWNGCFNSIQVVCRERDIVKREHRSGMYIFSYISAHMIYQAFLCLLQTIITIAVCVVAGIKFPAAGFVTPWIYLDIGITLFLTTYAADMMSLMISCIVRNTTSAMTVMPLVLIVQLVLSGIMFPLGDDVARYSGITIAKWCMNCICALAAYNSLPMVTVWNQLYAFRNYEIEGQTPIIDLMQRIEQNGMRDDFLLETGAAQAVAEYESSISNVTHCWLYLIGFAVLFALLAMVFLKRVNHDRR